MDQRGHLYESEEVLFEGSLGPDILDLSLQPPMHAYIYACSVCLCMRISMHVVYAYAFLHIYVFLHVLVHSVYTEFTCVNLHHCKNKCHFDIWHSLQLSEMRNPGQATPTN